VSKELNRQFRAVSDRIVYFSPTVETNNVGSLTSAAEMSWKALKARRPNSVLFRKLIAVTRSVQQC